MGDRSLYVREDDIASKSVNGSEKCMSIKNLEYRLAKNKGPARKMYAIECASRNAIAARKPTNSGGENGGGDI